jgi:predicted DNA-binding transcriptional regulator YafY
VSRGPGSDRNRMLVRALRLATYLRGRRYMPRVPDIARELGCDKRTVYRDINALEEAHWPLPMRTTKWDA